MEMKKDFGFGTRAIHAGYESNKYGALTTPIYQTSTFVFEDAEQGGRRFELEEDGYIYGRLGNPTVKVIEEKIAHLEGAEAAVAMSSGMGAITSVFWTILSAGDHVVASKTLYGCTYAFLSHGLTRYGVDVTFVDGSSIEEIRGAMRENTKIVYLETPANPNLLISDIKATAEIVKDYEDCYLVVDNTFNTPYIQRPIELGADVVVHSATKFLNGHGDVVAGFAVGSKEFITEVAFFGIKDMTGSVLGPFEAYLIQRGMKTLELRMEKHSENAMKVAEFLEKHPKVEKVYYPGLPNFPQHDLAKTQMSLYGSIISFEISGGKQAGINFINSLDLCTLAVSLGDCETLIQHPASMTHSPYTEEERAESGIAEGLIRLSVGLEEADDIIADLKIGLDKL